MERTGNTGTLDNEQLSSHSRLHGKLALLGRRIPTPPPFRFLLPCIPNPPTPAVPEPNKGGAGAFQPGYLLVPCTGSKRAGHQTHYRLSVVSEEGA